MKKKSLDPKTLLKLISEHSPDMMWIKDLNNKYLYANAYMCENFLVAHPSEVLGKDDYFFAEREIKKHPENRNWFNFGTMCNLSDLQVIKEKKTLRFNESGYIRGKYKHFEIDKAPFYDEDGKIIGTIGVGRDITRRILLEQKNEKLMYFDQLTKLPNRQKIIKDIEIKKPSACIVFNINDFKEVNDFFGTNNADKILKDVAWRFKKNKYNAYRIDGDEFAIMFFEEKSTSELQLEAKKVLKLLDEEPFYIEDKTVLVSFSVGIAKSDKNILTKVDIAVNNAKKSNSNIFIYQESLNVEESYRKNIQLATCIKEALRDNRIVCHYQPLLDLETSKIYSYESLVRMIDKDGNILTPNKFLNFSKRIKLYSSITRKVIEKTCKKFQDRDENFSINLSVDDINDIDTVNFIFKIIEETKTASRITFEILESEGIENYKQVISFINRVKNLGVKIAIDDFGTGYSNFEHLLRLDVDYIKIDGSLIKNIVSDNKHQIIVETIVNFAQKIGVKTVAEFVSDENILNTIRTIGISCAQGFHVGKPEPL